MILQRSELINFFKKRQGNYRLHGSSAVEMYLDNQTGHHLDIITDQGMIDLARNFDSLDFPGLPSSDALLKEKTASFYFSQKFNFRTSRFWPIQDFYYDIKRDCFIDPSNVLPLIKKRIFGDLIQEPQTEEDIWALWSHIIILTGRLGFTLRKEILNQLPEIKRSPASTLQKKLLSMILTGKYPQEAFFLAQKSGILTLCWPELAALSRIDHHKDFHPEGNVWQHTLCTLVCRKDNSDIDLSLALLLHDLGKQEAAQKEGKRFYQHAQLGGPLARNFLRRLDYNPDRIKRIVFLVENHMLPAAIKDLPDYRIRDRLKNPLFPKLLEVFRCDLLSTYGDPEDYYRACKFYKAFLRRQNNPYQEIKRKRSKKRIKSYC